MKLNLHYLIFFSGVVIAAFSQVLLKISASKTYRSVIREYLNPYVICGYGMLFLSMLFSIIGYRGMEYMNGPIIESLGFVLVTILGYLFFKEKISKRKILGILLILSGIVVYHMEFFSL